MRYESEKREWETRPTRKLGLYETEYFSTAYQNCKKLYYPRLTALSPAQFRRMLNLIFHLSSSNTSVPLVWEIGNDPVQFLKGLQSVSSEG